MERGLRARVRVCVCACACVCVCACARVAEMRLSCTGFPMPHCTTHATHASHFCVQAREFGVGAWADVARVLGNRTDNQCWRRWKKLNAEKVKPYMDRVRAKVCVFSMI